MGRPKGSKNKASVETESSLGVSQGNEQPKVSGLPIEDLDSVMAKVKELIKEKEFNPGAIQDGDTGVAFKDGEPHMIIDNEYVPFEKARIILQTRKVVREWIRLDNLLHGVIDETL